MRNKQRKKGSESHQSNRRLKYTIKCSAERCDVSIPMLSSDFSSLNFDTVAVIRHLAR